MVCISKVGILWGVAMALTAVGADGVQSPPSQTNAIRSVSPPPMKAESRQVNLSPMARDVADVVALAEDGDFTQAFKNARALRNKYRTDPKVRIIDDLIEEMSELRRSSIELPQAIQNLAADTQRTVEMSNQIILEAGPAGRILLRKALRTEKDPVAIPVIRLLGRMADTNSVPVFQDQLLGEVSGARRTALTESLARLVDATGTAFLAELCRRVREDGQFTRRQEAELLLAAYLRCSQRDRNRFNERVGAPSAAFVLRTYVTAAMGSTNAALAAWGQQQAAVAGFQMRGLRGSYYTGMNFNTLALERLDEEINLDQEKFPYPDGRKEDLSIRWTGYLIVDTPGLYTIYSTCDDGQRVWIDGEMVIDDWVMHAPEERSATRDLTPGAHVLKIEYMQGTGGGSIAVAWEGPGFTKRLISGTSLGTSQMEGFVGVRTVAGQDREAVSVLQELLLMSTSRIVRNAVLLGLNTGIRDVETGFLQRLVSELRADREYTNRHFADLLAAAYALRAQFNEEAFDKLAGKGSSAVLKDYVKVAESSGKPELVAWAKSLALTRLPGLRGAYYEGTAFGKLLHEQLDAAINIPDRQYPIPGGRADDLSARWTGFLIVTRAGKYTISSAADDGQRVWVDEKPVIDDWNMHGVTEVAAVVDLSVGEHAFKVEHMQGGGGGSITVSWSGPGIEKQVIPTTNLRTTPWQVPGK